MYIIVNYFGLKGGGRLTWEIPSFISVFFFLMMINYILSIDNLHSCPSFLHTSPEKKKKEKAEQSLSLLRNLPPDPPPALVLDLRSVVPDKRGLVTNIPRYSTVLQFLFQVANSAITTWVLTMEISSYF